MRIIISLHCWSVDTFLVLVFALSGFPGSLVVKNLPAMQETGFDPWVRKITWRKEGYPLQYSCLENSKDRGAWQDAVHGVTKGWTWRSNCHLHFCFITSDCHVIHGMINGWPTDSYLTRATAKNELSLEWPMFFNAELSKVLFFWYLNYNMQLMWLLCQPIYWSEETCNEQPCSVSKIKPVLL